MLIYEGPSAINRNVIIQGIITFDSSNVKTGPMAQLWILVKDEAPHHAQKTGNDVAVCGACPQRPKNPKGKCYVTTWQGPRATWEAHKGQEVQSLRSLHVPLRFGAYGDPLALPKHILLDLLSKAQEGHTGYTHQWGKAKNQWASSFLMASTENEKGLESARKKGWKVFHIVNDLKEADDIQLCDNSVTGIQCIDCLKCDGRGHDVKIKAHGSKATRGAK